MDNQTEKERFLLIVKIIGGVIAALVLCVAVVKFWPVTVQAMTAYWQAYFLLRLIVRGIVYLALGSIVLLIFVAEKPYFFTEPNGKFASSIGLVVCLGWPIATLALCIQLALSPAQKMFERVKERNNG